MYDLKSLKIKCASHKGPGKLITVNGMDGCGKTTMIKKIYTYIKSNNVAVCRTRLPTEGMRRTRMFKLFAQQQREDLIDMIALQVQHMADKIQHSKKFIKPRIKQGTVVLCDRYLYSTMGMLLQRSVSIEEWFKSLCCELIEPDFSIMMYAPADIALRRIRERPNEWHMRIDKKRLTRSLKLAKTVAMANEMIIIDSSQLNPDECLDVVRPYIDDLLKNLLSHYDK